MPAPRPVFLLTEQMNQPHGTEMLAALLISGLARWGHPIHLFTSQYSRRRSVWAEFLTKYGVIVHHPGFWRFTRFRLPHRVCAWRLRRAARRIRPALVMAVDNDPLCCEALRTWDVDVPFCVHDPSEASPACPHYEPLWFQVCHRVTGLSVHGERQARSARAYYSFHGPVAVVWPSCFGPVQPPPPPNPGDAIRFGLFGRLIPLKGGIFAVAALHQVIQQGGRAELHFFGAGPSSGELRAKAASLGMGELVRFHGPYLPTEIDRPAAEVDVALMPSLYEGFGIVMLELMSRSRPVIASDVGSSREVLGEFGGGIVVKRADAASLGEAMLRYCREPALITRDGARARQLYETHFTPGAMMERYRRFWKSVGVALES